MYYALYQLLEVLRLLTTVGQARPRKLNYFGLRFLLDVIGIPRKYTYSEHRLRRMKRTVTLRAQRAESFRQKLLAYDQRSFHTGSAVSDLQAAHIINVVCNNLTRKQNVVSL